MEIAMLGTGYVGLVSGAAFAEMGHTVHCIDIDKKKIETLNQGQLPIYEPGLLELIKRGSDQSRLSFTTDQNVIKRCDVVFFCLPTPSDADGSCDTSYVIKAARSIAPLLKPNAIVVMKSTVPVGTCDTVDKLLKDEGAEAHVVSNPEFLKEGSAVSDAMKPDRIVIGFEDSKAKQVMETLYTPFTLNHNRMLFMNRKSAELTKYAANAMLATRISFMNELSHLCDQVGADIQAVRTGIGSDSRIGYSFLYSGPGYGGSCFPKDIKALQATAKQEGVKLRIVQAVEEANEYQKNYLFSKAYNFFKDKGGLEGKTFAVWGLAFKPDTDDVRESPALALITALVSHGAFVQVYDPVALENGKKALSYLNNVEYCTSEYDVVKNVDALFLVTEWKQFRFCDLERVKELMNEAILFDGRNQYSQKAMRENGFTYYSIGRGTNPVKLLEELLEHSKTVHAKAHI